MLKLANAPGQLGGTALGGRLSRLGSFQLSQGLVPAGLRGVQLGCGFLKAWVVVFDDVMG